MLIRRMPFEVIGAPSSEGDPQIGDERPVICWIPREFVAVGAAEKCDRGRAVGTAVDIDVYYLTSTSRGISPSGLAHSYDYPIMGHPGRIRRYRNRTGTLCAKSERQRDSNDCGS